MFTIMTRPFNFWGIDTAYIGSFKLGWEII